MKVGDRVYHRKIKANGFIEEIDDTKAKDKYKVRFFWGRHAPDIPHGHWSGDPEYKWMYCASKNLQVQKVYTHGKGQNKVTIIGGRSLDKLIRKVCEIGRRRPNDGSDIIINYGMSNHSVSRSIPMINRKLISNKWHQCEIMVDCTPEIQLLTDRWMAENAEHLHEYIVKPYYSIGGRDIMPVVDIPNRITGQSHYIQRRINKVREFRAHVFLWADDAVPLIQEKFIEDTSQLCWNKKQGSEFRCPWQPIVGRQKLGRENLTLLTNIKQLAVDACKKLHYDMGGVDIGLDDKGNLFVFEINSRMGLREQSFITYKDAFWQLMGLDIKRYMKERGW